MKINGLNRGRARRVGIIAIVGLLVTGLVATPASAGMHTVDASELNQTTDSVPLDVTDNVTVTYTVSVADAPSGSVSINLSVTDGYDGVLVVALPDDSDVRSTGGFNLSRGGYYQLDSERASGSIEYTIAVNSTAGLGNTKTMATNTWALLEYDQITADFARPSRGGYEEIHPDDRHFGGSHIATGESKLMVGAYEQFTVASRGSDTTITVNIAGEPLLSPEDIVSHFRAYSGAIDYTPRIDGNLTVFVLPDSVAEGGLFDGDVTTTAEGPYIAHEYFHARTTGTGHLSDMDANMEWFVEASAQYFGYVLSYKHGHVSTYDIERAIGRVGYGDSGVLAQPERWESASTPYDEGSTTLYALDVRIRNLTDGEQSLADVTEQLAPDLAAPNNRLTLADFKTAVESVAGESLDGWIERHINGSATPEPPSVATFSAGGERDEDSDGLSDSEEIANGTNPFVNDTDHDGYSDAFEVSIDSRPTSYSDKRNIAFAYADRDDTFSDDALEKALVDWAQHEISDDVVRIIVRLWDGE